MRFLSRCIFVFIMSITLSTLAHSASEARFLVDKMTCATCPIAVKKAMQRVDGVKEIDIDFDKKLAVVIYDDSVTTPKAIADAASNVGFPTTAIANEKSE